MLIAVVVTLLDGKIVSPWWLLAGLVIGGGAGAYLAKTVQMTAMPQMVALFNGFGGVASVLVAGAALSSEALRSRTHCSFTIATAAAGPDRRRDLLGQPGRLRQAPGAHQPATPILLPGPAGAQRACSWCSSWRAAVWLVERPQRRPLYWILVLVASVLGVILVIPDRRRRHAGRHRAAELLLGSRRGGHRLRARATTC